MLPTSARMDLTELLALVGAALSDPGADLHPALLHVTRKLARLLGDIDDREFA